MSIDIATAFIEKTPTELASAWRYEAVIEMAARSLPDFFMRDQKPLLVGDQHRLWMRWFLEGMVSPSRLAADLKIGRLDVLENTMRRVNALYGDVDLERRKRLAEAATNHIFAMVGHIRSKTRRDHASLATRHALISANKTPRCYICGYAFSQQAQDAYLRTKGRAPIELPALVDVFRPRGLVERDERIEVEHIVPVASGGFGQENLRLACGWCNKHKSDRVSIYEAPFMAPRTIPFRMGRHQLNELPNPFWVVRILALRGRCQHIDGCDRTASDAELFVSLADWAGSPNPTNLVVHCEQHDPIRVDRRQSRENVEKIWQERRN